MQTLEQYYIDNTKDVEEGVDQLIKMAESSGWSGVKLAAVCAATVDAVFQAAEIITEQKLGKSN